jgi:hypothetical protein
MMEKKGQVLTDRQRYWLEQVKACKALGMSVSAYAAEQGFHVGAMYAGKKALVRKGAFPETQPSRFQRVQTAAVTDDTQWRIRLPSGILVGFPGTADAGSLSTVLNAMAGLG